MGYFHQVPCLAKNNNILQHRESLQDTKFQKKNNRLFPNESFVISLEFQRKDIFISKMLKMAYFWPSLTKIFEKPI